MNYIKENTAGVDTPIKRIKNYLYNTLVTKWDVSNLDAYGRVYRNENRDMVMPEYYLDNGEYKDVTLSDNKDGIIFFDIGDNHNVDGNVINVDCEIIFTLNISALYGDETRSDAEARKEAFNALNLFRGTFTIESIETGLKNVYSNFRGVAGLFLDMQEFHHFKISGKINYTNNC